MLLATQNTNVENICGTEGAKAKGRKEYCRDRCLTADGLGIELNSASVLLLVLYKCIVVTLELWRFQLGAKNYFILNGMVYFHFGPEILPYLL